MANKTQPTAVSPADFIAALPGGQKKTDAEWLLTTLTELSGHPPKMWGPSIIGFGSYHYQYASGREGDWMEIGFSPRKANLTLYLMSGVEREEDLLARLGKYKTGKSCLYLKRLSDVDPDVLKQLVTRSLERIRKMDIDY